MYKLRGVGHPASESILRSAGADPVTSESTVAHLSPYPICTAADGSGYSTAFGAILGFSRLGQGRVPSRAAYPFRYPICRDRARFGTFEVSFSRGHLIEFAYARSCSVTKAPALKTDARFQLRPSPWLNDEIDGWVAAGLSNIVSLLEDHGIRGSPARRRRRARRGWVSSALQFPMGRVPAKAAFDGSPINVNVPIEA